MADKKSTQSRQEAATEQRSQQHEQERDALEQRRSQHGLEHTRGGVTTRDDALDLGVPMLPGDPDEPVGPEDAFGPGPKRGDYSGRVGLEGYQPHQSVPVEDPGPGESHVRVVAQRERASQQGEQAKRKGGVTTSDEG